MAADPATVAQVLAESQVNAVVDELERDLIGLVPVKQRIRDIAAAPVIDKLRMNLGLRAQTPSLHMNFTGNPGTNKTTVTMRMADILLALRVAQPHFANARSVRNALDRARLRQASRLFAQPGRELTRDDPTTLEASDIRASRLFHGAHP